MHDHVHGHDTSNRTRLAIALGITAAILVAEVVGAVVTGSLALLVDAAHMLTDTIGLAVALVAAALMARPPSARRTWGWQRAEVLAAGGQATILLAVGVYAAVEGVQRLLAPPEIRPSALVLVGVVGLLGNLVCLLVLSGSRGSNLNMRAAFLEVVNDALGSVAVIVSAIVIATTGWARADAVAGLLVAALIVPRALVLLRESGSILLESVPSGLDLAEVRRHILEVDHVVDVHDLHASVVATGLPVLSAHVVLADECFSDGHALRILDHLQECVAGHFAVSVEHSTFQLEAVSHRDHEAHVHA
ncbi:cation diffusion facilitator family transporter [Arsenicicoccus cauae]|uniref:cation diffusion facilitator family transporter n=1 Tax=Arsenicicoccus cauae TaxID=2663847 RepID=UPI00370D9B71